MQGKLNAFTDVEVTRDEVERVLKKAADLIRTRVDYKFILILLFLKKLSDEWWAEYRNAVERLEGEGVSEEGAKELANDKSFHKFNYPEEYTWERLRKVSASELPIKLSEALKLLANRNPELQGVVDRVDFLEFTMHRENLEILRQLFEEFSGLPLGNVSPDVLGDAYEWILRYFAPQKAKEGEVYTPREVVKLLVELLDPKPLESVYDPAAGSGGMLIHSYYHVKGEHGEGGAKKLFLYGQEVNPTTYGIAKMNAILHGIKDVELYVGDTLRSPKIKDGETFRKFDVVIANPPWNQDGYGEKTLKKAEFCDERYGYGFSPNNSADWAWIQHMVASAKEDTGRIGVVIDNGCLFRGGREKTIRQRILKDDLVECVILLPEKLFYNTGAPGAILIFNKNKPAERRGRVLFINASNEYEQHPEVRKLNRLGEGHIKKIVDAYREFKDGDGFSRVVSLDEIKENDYNLNVTLYVFPKEEVEEIDVAKEWEELKIIEEEVREVEDKVSEYLSELGFVR
ncbi:MAG TPA: type I restriction-modification system subunit M [Methermicoccus shengliensis]|uniref:site-specific DNA-methyltransferase (adenine-specific) n=2 Tax=Methermicoccus shengliensis TaxID=660064 RepID=A0A832RT51_9EURY|nr:MAG: Site-specific DNA-methyltransferase (Adenine-specific) [Euryarchaeota archaeon 55_53]KUK30830.1 MAG: Site-specific DNA-methyltransferase (Adenine-specific) [Methanosarcinales archeaon 56_1174]MDI3487371.1 type restriction enzyme protein [Methanosarcinales archaeon]MDN5294555.1 type restriction enzyme protein [Methanosarcinales archaeon]HIH69715.1 type I restriction-modification system subunit M [Methermicoccus shengliensis]